MSDFIDVNKVHITRVIPSKAREEDDDKYIYENDEQ
jgi:hypothetical protein